RGRSVGRAASTETRRIVGVKVDAGRHIPSGDNQRVEPAVRIGKGVRRGYHREDVENAGPLVMRVTAARRQVKGLRSGRGEGELSERRVALRPGGAMPLHEPILALPDLIA